VDPLHVSSMFFGIKRYIRKYNIKKKYWFTLSDKQIWKRYSIPLGFVSYKNIVVDAYTGTFFYRLKFFFILLMRKFLNKLFITWEFTESFVQINLQGNSHYEIVKRIHH
jgi:hypothetical protein